jgi:hypothetical protein
VGQSDSTFSRRVAGVFIPIPYSVYNITDIFLCVNALWLFSFFLNKKNHEIFAGINREQNKFPGAGFPHRRARQAQLAAQSVTCTP